MSAPTPEEVNEMDRLRKILNGEISADTKPTKSQRTLNENGNEPFIVQHGPTNKDIDAMSKIMKNFSSATGVKSYKSPIDGGTHTAVDNVVGELVDRAQNDSVLREAMATRKTDNGVKIGSWEIRKKIQEGITGRDETVYKLVNTETNQHVKAPLIVYESAKAIATLLNSGVPLQDKKIKEIAKLEIEYRNQRQQALEEKVFWQRAKKSNNQFKQDLYEAKFDAAQTRALLTKERIRNIYLSLNNKL